MLIRERERERENQRERERENQREREKQKTNLIYRKLKFDRENSIWFQDLISMERIELLQKIVWQEMRWERY